MSTLRNAIKSSQQGIPNERNGGRENSQCHLASVVEPHLIFNCAKSQKKSLLFSSSSTSTRTVWLRE